MLLTSQKLTVTFVHTVAHQPIDRIDAHSAAHAHCDSV